MPRSLGRELFSLFAVSIMGALLSFPTEGFSQADEKGRPPGAEQGQAAQSEQTYAPVGQSGYRVPIPEIKMRRIIGGPPPSTTEPSKEIPEVSPAEKQLPAEPTPTQTPDEPPKSEESKVEHLPFEPAPRRSEPERLPEPPPQAAPPEKEQRSPLVAIPTAPEDLMEAPPPKKEILKKKAGPKTPSLVQSPPGKGTVSTFGLTPTRVDPPPQEEWIPLIPRGEMEVLPPPEPTPAREPEPAPEQPPTTEPSPQPKTQPALPSERLPQEIRPSSPAEQPPAPPAARPLAPAEELAPAPPAEQLPPPPIEDVLLSPLAGDALGDREVKDYLKAAAPILEELSLLMTRVPSLKIDDFDPSKTDAAVVPEDVFLKLDSTKRMLQVLDSKAFAIIPPAKYSGFHSMVRESITETHLACEAIMSFFQNGDDSDLGKIRNHIQKARELIQKTRKRSG